MSASSSPSRSVLFLVAATFLSLSACVRLVPADGLDAGRSPSVTQSAPGLATPSAAPSAARTGHPALVSDAPTASPGATPSPWATPSPAPTASPWATPSPAASPSPDATPRRRVRATRVVVKSLGIDLPIISRDRRVLDQGPDQYPPCDVALYHTAFQQPGRPGTTYLYGHAREGMFLPLLEASERDDGKEMLGKVVRVYTSDDKLHLYHITKVKRHATDFSLVTDAPPDAEQLILQTSEGPRGTVPKLQVLAVPYDVREATREEARPQARPRACYNTP